MTRGQTLACCLRTCQTRPEGGVRADLQWPKCSIGQILHPSATLLSPLIRGLYLVSFRTLLFSYRFRVVSLAGIEPATHWLCVSCSTKWAIVMELPVGFEPTTYRLISVVLPGWTMAALFNACQHRYAVTYRAASVRRLNLNHCCWRGVKFLCRSPIALAIGEKTAKAVLLLAYYLNLADF